ncbi:MAG: DUF2934 domain-containing protein [Verrucomicrobia bacterium]|nr:DUF2934 domain-containing protein [Verrucomicrobiota bacterium]
MNQLNTTLPNHDEIALCAFLIWEKDGRQPGREQTYWLQAEAHLHLARQQQAERAASKSARPWPPQATTAPKLASARAAAPAAPKTHRLAAASRAVSVKQASVAKSSARKPASSASARKSLARN